MCQARGCAAKAYKKSGVWCPRHRRVLRAADLAVAEDTEMAARMSQEWTRAVRHAQELILGADKEDQDAAKQTEMF